MKLLDESSLKSFLDKSKTTKEEDQNNMEDKKAKKGGSLGKPKMGKMFPLESRGQKGKITSGSKKSK